MTGLRNQWREASLWRTGLNQQHRLIPVGTMQGAAGHLKRRLGMPAWGRTWGSTPLDKPYRFQ